MTNLAHRLKDARASKKLTQGRVAEFIGVAQSTYAHWERGRGMPTPQQIEELAKLLSSNPEWIMFGKNPREQPRLPKASFITEGDEAPIPVYRTPVSAGPGTELVDQTNEPEYYFQASQTWLREWTTTHPKHLGFIRVSGSSMEPNIYDGELVLVDFSCRRFDGDGIYVLRSVGDVLQLKRVIFQYGSGGYVVRNDNHKYPAFKVGPDGIEIWAKALVIVGRKLD